MSGLTTSLSSLSLGGAVSSSFSLGRGGTTGQFSSGSSSSPTLGGTLPTSSASLLSNIGGLPSQLPNAMSTQLGEYSFSSYIYTKGTRNMRPFYIQDKNVCGTIFDSSQFLQ